MSSRLKQRLEKQLNLLSKMKKKSHETLNASGPSAGDSFLVEHEKIDTLKKKVEEEKGKYLNSVNISRAMMLNNLQMGLPNVFQAMTRFSSVCAQSFEAVDGHAKGTSRQDDSTTAV
ncbi:hypothetical protein MRB53_024722 [Persea americana]|uniref:Uncharacterized protein n=1 Tax=Persea americana TaxID=3435 RepID=A0ACC2LD77_PERAE|nr:hypothetical protein MRB53_024722 [Persea americana]